MFMFILTISCLTVSNLPWFIDLIFQVPMQYCSLQHQILFSSPDTSTTEYPFRFGPAASFFLGLLEVLMASILGGLPFPPPVDHVLPELSTVTHPSWVALHSMAHSFTSSPFATTSATAHVKWSTDACTTMAIVQKSWKNSEKWACWYKNKIG